MHGLAPLIFTFSGFSSVVPIGLLGYQARLLRLRFPEDLRHTCLAHSRCSLFSVLLASYASFFLLRDWSTRPLGAFASLEELDTSFPLCLLRSACLALPWVCALYREIYMASLTARFRLPWFGKGVFVVLFVVLSLPLRRAYLARLWLTLFFEVACLLALLWCACLTYDRLNWYVGQPSYWTPTFFS